MLRVLVGLLLLVITTAWGQVPTPEVTVSQLDAAVERVTTSLPEDDPQRAALLKSYADTREALASFDQSNQAFREFALLRENAAQQSAVIQQGLAAAETAAPDSNNPNLTSVPLRELEQMIQLNKAELDAKKGRLADTRAALDAMPGRLTEIRERATELVDIAQGLESQLSLMNPEPESGGGEEASLWLAKAQYANVNMEKGALNEEMLSQPMRLELLNANLDRASYDISLLEAEARALSMRAGELRKQEVVQARSDATLAVADTKGKHEMVRQLADENAELTETFIGHSEAINEAREQNIEIEGRAEKIEKDLTSIGRKLELLGMNASIGQVLRDRQAQLPNPRDLVEAISNNEQDITSSSLRQTELEEERRKLRHQQSYVEQYVQGVNPQVLSRIGDDISGLVASRRELIQKAIELENTYAVVLSNLDFTLRRYEASVDQYRTFVSERLLWIPSREMFSLFRMGDLVTQAKEVFKPGRWLSVLMAMPGELLKRPFAGLTLLAAILLMYFSNHLLRYLTETGKQVGYVRSDKFVLTVEALLITVLLSVKWPLLLLTVSWLFEMQKSESELAMALSFASQRMLFYYWGLEFLRIALYPEGLITRHFRWPANLGSLISRRVVTLEWIFLPAVFFVVLFLNLYPREVGGGLGSLAVILVLFSLSHFFRGLPPFLQSKIHLMYREEKSEENSFLGKAIRGLLYWIPIAAIIGVFFGYTYSAMEMALLLTRTFVLLGCILIVHDLGVRWLRLTQRRMNFNVRHEQAKNSASESENSIEEDIRESDPEILNDEGTKLLNLLTLFASLVGIALIWVEVFPALGVLDSVELWQQSDLVDGLQVVVPVTLGGLLETLVVTAMGWVALRRVPSLLEILLRQRVGLPPASAYASTRVVQYAGTTLLVVYIIGAMGGSWSSMQWAVAALSLGIGFGLQEIVANFICGLIILFEQPIRLGDVVTVGDVSGRVTRIQMRATTIRDFDNRELLVPNKEFITSRLLNWSLSDPVTRRVVEVGVAYGTDMDKAMAIVRDVARRHPIVLSDPESMITFDEFGDNSLLISLRYFIENLEMRRKVDSEIRLEINRRFIQEGIEVAFPQRDIHIDAREPLEIKMVPGDAGI